MIKYVLYAVCTCSTLLTFWILFQYRGIKEHLISVIASHYNDFNTQVGHQQCFVRLKLFLHSILDFLSKSNKNWYKWMFLLLTMLLEQEGLQTVHCISCWCQSPLICFTNWLFQILTKLFIYLSHYQLADEKCQFKVQTLMAGSSLSEAMDLFMPIIREVCSMMSPALWQLYSEEIISVLNENISLIHIIKQIHTLEWNTYGSFECNPPPLWF